MECPRCHAETRDGLKFCEDCGARLGLTCSQCGAEVTSGKRFCGSCGAPVVAQTPDRFAAPKAYTPKHLAEKILTSRRALEGERKQVTVLFADLKGSMELLADRDPEEARKILDPVIERMMEAVHHYEGTVNQVMGDGIMALFGAPIGHEDHAVRASYAALRMQRRVNLYRPASSPRPTPSTRARPHRRGCNVADGRATQSTRGLCQQWRRPEHGGGAAHALGSIIAAIRSQCGYHPREPGTAA